MATTYSNANKFAFLFTGPVGTVTSAQRYETDLLKVYQTLTEYYNYLPANIWVVAGATLTSPGSFGPNCTENAITLALVESPLKVFANAVAAATDATAFLYFTGGSGASGDANILVNGSVYIDSMWLSERLTGVATGFNSIALAYVHIVMQQSYAGAFIGNIMGLTNYSLTTACGSAEDISGSAYELGGCGIFTNYWNRGLQFNALPAGVHIGQYADQLLGGTSKIINLQQAMQFAIEYGTLGSTPGWDSLCSADSLSLGLPYFIIRDGSPYWWESEDIFLHHPNHPAKADSDLYVPDAIGSVSPYNNTINVRVRNTGTHPVRTYGLYIEQFRSGLGYSNETILVSNHPPASGVLKPVIDANIGTASDVYDTYEWNTPFYLGVTHECIRAEAKLLSTDIDTAWESAISTNDFEAQRNTDISGDPPAAAGSALSKKPGNTFRGNTKHLYFVANPFRETHTFWVTFPFNFKKHHEVLNMNWLTYNIKNEEERIKIIDVDEHTKGFMLQLKGGERKPVIFEFGFVHDEKLPGKIKIPIEILVNRLHGDNTRKPLVKSLHDKYAAIAGLTVVLERARASLFGLVVDAKGNPVPKAMLHISTINGLHTERLHSAANGRFELESINPGVYKIVIEAEGKQQKEENIYLIEPKHLELKFQLNDVKKHRRK